MKPSSDVAFTESVKRQQTERGSRAAYARMERNGGFRTEVTADLVEFLADIDTAFFATASAEGQPYVQHRGGPKGFIRAVDAHTLAFLDYTGNRQYVSAGNLAENDKVCLFLIDFATRRRVKVWGTARMVDLPNDQRIVEITVTAWDINCPKHINPANALPTEARRGSPWHDEQQRRLVARSASRGPSRVARAPRPSVRSSPCVHRDHPDVPFPDSLCHRCAHLRVVRSGRGSGFLMCREPTLPKYASQPIRTCPGFAPKTTS